MAVLLLQGPLGPFFQTLAGRLRQERETVYRVVFNGGDAAYADERAISYRGTPGKQWQAYFTNLIKSLDIHAVLVYGDCRVYHAEAKAICQRLNTPYYVFEEGYLRPNYITLEKGGVNGHSPLRLANFQAIEPLHKIADEQVVGGNFMRRGWYASYYYCAAALARVKFADYLHHRSFSPVYEAFCWVRSGLRKQVYKLTQRDAQQRICAQPFFLVPLQVFNDAQLLHHSSFTSIGQFIRLVLESYQRSGVAARLVFKHHPMDRGHVHYGSLIRGISTQLGVQERVDYVHDLHLPTLLKHTAGVITINSTTALQAFYHVAPVKVMGEAFFDLPGLTDQQTLADFWLTPQAPDEILADKFKHYLVAHGQINGSFYSKLPMTLDNLVPYLRELGVIKSKPQRSWCGFRAQG
jgi:capsular polysaccharide export protein